VQLLTRMLIQTARRRYSVIRQAADRPRDCTSAAGITRVTRGSADDQDGQSPHLRAIRDAQ
jgi:hypothetical protein